MVEKWTLIRFPNDIPLRLNMKRSGLSLLARIVSSPGYQVTSRTRRRDPTMSAVALLKRSIKRDETRRRRADFCFEGLLFPFIIFLVLVEFVDWACLNALVPVCVSPDRVTLHAPYFMSRDLRRIKNR